MSMWYGVLLTWEINHIPRECHSYSICRMNKNAMLYNTLMCDMGLVRHCAWKMYHVNHELTRWDLVILAKTFRHFQMCFLKWKCLNIWKKFPWSGCCYWKLWAVTLPTLSWLAAPVVVIMTTTSNATSDSKMDIMSTLVPEQHQMSKLWKFHSI